MPTRVPLKSPQCSGPLGVWRCRIFRSSSLRDRLRTVRQHRLCRACLSEGHSAKQCTRGSTCAKSGCGKDHHHLIHSDEVDVKGSNIQANRRDALRDAENKGTAVEAVADPRSVPRSIATNIGSGTPPRVSNNTTVLPGHPVTVGVVRAGRPRVCFKVVPVKVSGHSGTKEKVTYAFLLRQGTWQLTKT